MVCEVKELLRQADDMEKTARHLRRIAFMKESTRKRLERLRVEFNALKVDVNPEVYAEAKKLPLETVLVWLKEKRQREKKLALERRNREIIRLAREGYTNQHLATRFQLHPVTISRVIAARFRQRKRPMLADN